MSMAHGVSCALLSLPLSCSVCSLHFMHSYTRLRWTGDLKVNTDGGVGGFSAAYAPCMIPAHPSADAPLLLLALSLHTLVCWFVGWFVVGAVNGTTIGAEGFYIRAEKGPICKPPALSSLPPLFYAMHSPSSPLLSSSSQMLWACVKRCPSKRGRSRPP